MDNSLRPNRRQIAKNLLTLSRAMPAIVGNVLKSAAQIAGLVVGAPLAAKATAVASARYSSSPIIAKALNDLHALQAP